MKKLCESFEKFKVDNQTKTFANITASGAVNRSNSSRQGGLPNIQVTSPGPGSSWAAEVEGQFQGGHLGRAGQQVHRQAGHQIGRSVSPKRSREGGDHVGGGQGQEVGLKS